MQRNAVDLPEPDGPITQTTSPAATEKLTPLSTSMRPKVFLTSRNSMLPPEKVGPSGSVAVPAPAAALFEV
jgi:hypothetical protein